MKTACKEINRNYAYQLQDNPDRTYQCQNNQGILTNIKQFQMTFQFCLKMKRSYFIRDVEIVKCT